jgi:transketolase
MRDTFIAELVKQARINKNIILMVGDLGFSVVEPFQEEFPDRFINAGVAEQNMMGVAAGMASEGCHVFVYSIANFPTFRCAEQIRNDVDYHKLPVTIVSVGGGLSYGNLGYSHHAIQDYALMRAMPNMLIASPGDPSEVAACVRYITYNPQPTYLRLGKAGERTLHDDSLELAPGRWVSLKNDNLGSQNALLATGYGLQIAATWLKNPRYENWSLYSLPLWGMKFKEIQSAQVGKFQKIVTVEDHLLDGGFGSWMLESLIKRSDLIGRIHPKYLDSVVCGLTADQHALHLKGGLVA